MEHEPEERTKRSRFKNKFYVELQRDGEDIVEKYYDIVKHHTGFNLDFDIEKQGEIYVCSFYLMSEDYPETDLYLNSVAFSNYNYFYDEGRKAARGAGVKSIISGKRLGEIVFNLQLLLSIISGVEEVTLLNFTDDQVRAMEGIYKLFDIDKRKYDRKNFTGKSKAEKIHESEGEMRFILKSNSEDFWNKNWKEIINKLETEKTARSKNKEKSKKHKKKKKHTKRKKKKKRKSKKSKMR